MKKLFKFFITLFILLNFSAMSYAQEKQKSPDDLLKEQLYLQYKKKIINYNRKEFDNLFFEFFKVQNDKSKILTKEEFYQYTVQIAVHSERLAKLYPDRKAEAEQAKNEWMARSYEDYLNSHNSSNKPVRSSVKPVEKSTATKPVKTK